ncbi:hypothetical protein CC78DRAFT_581412 [Lojkania enalia]|uniref:Prokaryotic-type class I peptide chain release factors domain-containing protein n=1 Tax=Lojkania enalia TaxID=147567 RepID=A0A9P4K7J6_9PLEO|nr:hypothetical protein CC78DRAFT_581412 [Didymosphaeria enalia]
MLLPPAHPVLCALATRRLPVVVGVRFEATAARYQTKGDALATGKRRRTGQEREQDLRDARLWLELGINEDMFPKTIGTVTYSRSSGPGGQNVNKVNSKATLKVLVENLVPYLPPPIYSAVQSLRYITPRSDTIVIQSDESRDRKANANACWAKLRQAVQEAGRAAIPGETSKEQAQHVKNLQESDNQRRLYSKKRHSAKKSSRRARGND